VKFGKFEEKRRVFIMNTPKEKWLAITEEIRDKLLRNVSFLNIKEVWSDLFTVFLPNRVGG
jgi:hypothetical protein